MAMGRRISSPTTPRVSSCCSGTEAEASRKRSGVRSFPTGSITGINSVTVGDFNGDGNPDLFVVRTPTSTSKGEVVIMLGNGSGSFTQAAGGATYASPSSNLQNAVVADFNGDGRTDIAVTDPGNDAVVVLRGEPAAAQPISVTPNAGSSLTQTFTFTFNAPGGWQVSTWPRRIRPVPVGSLWGCGMSRA